LESSFGEAVMTSGGEVCVSAYCDDGRLEWVYRLDQFGNALAAYDHPASGVDDFGSSLAVDGDTVVSGAVFEDVGAPSACAAFVFRSGRGWSVFIRRTVLL
jgi:hypothetical protein